MRPENSDSRDREASNQTGGMPSPEPAARAEVERVEKAAEEGREKADSAHERCEDLEQQVRDLRQENEQLRDLVGRLTGALHRVDQHLTSVEENIGTWGNNYETEPIGEMFELPDPNKPMDGDDEDGESPSRVEVSLPEGVEVPAPSNNDESA